MTTALPGPLHAPFPYFGGKRTVAADVWARFGDVPNYVEPFAGSLAVLLGRPHAPGTETVNDMDGLVCNFWRAVAADPDAVAGHANGPVLENDLHARHAWLVARKDRLQERLEGDPDFYDVRVAGWWVWGISLWIGSGWCSGRGPWSVKDGCLVKGERGGAGVHRKLPTLSDAGRGVFRQIPSLGSGRKPVSRRETKGAFRALSQRLERVRVACGTWSRITTPSITGRRGLTAVFLDPPYSAARETVYRVDDATVALAAREWAVAHGDDPRFRIALCGYEGEHAMPETWREFAGKERIWFSPHCLNPTS